MDRKSAPFLIDFKIAHSVLALMDPGLQEGTDMSWFVRLLASPKSQVIAAYPQVQSPTSTISILCFQGNPSFNSLHNDIIWLK